MSADNKSEVLSILQPDLLPLEKLIEIIESRCCRAENLRLMSKEGLVELFRRVVLPLPQRLYRTNRRGKMLTARRAKAGLSSERKEEGATVSGSIGRLKPPPDISNSHKLRLNSGSNRSRDLDKIVIKDRRNSEREDSSHKDKSSRADSPSSRKITLKRPSEKPTSTPSPTDSKRQRTAIKWP